MTRVLINTVTVIDRIRIVHTLLLYTYATKRLQQAGPVKRMCCVCQVLMCCYVQLPSGLRTCSKPPEATTM